MAHIICNVHVNLLVWIWLLMSHLLAFVCVLSRYTKRYGQRQTQTDPIEDHLYRIVIEPDDNIGGMIRQEPVHI